MDAIFPIPAYKRPMNAPNFGHNDTKTDTSKKFSSLAKIEILAVLRKLTKVNSLKSRHQICHKNLVGDHNRHICEWSAMESVFNDLPTLEHFPKVGYASNVDHFSKLVHFAAHLRLAESAAPPVRKLSALNTALLPPIHF